MRTVAEMIDCRNAPVAPGSDGLGFRIADLAAHDCRFPVRQDRAGVYFCGEPGEGSYCAFHRAFLRGQPSVFDDERRAA